MAEIEKRSAKELVTAPSGALTKRVIPTLQKVEQISDEILGKSRVKELAQSEELLSRMSKRLHETKRKTPQNSFLRFLYNRYYGLKFVIQKEITERKNIKTFLEEQYAAYQKTARNLEDNIIAVEQLKKVSSALAEELQLKVVALQQEKSSIEEQLPVWEQEDPELAKQARTVLARYGKFIADFQGMQYIHETSVAQLSTQITERRLLVDNMAVLGPQMQTLLKQQLAQMISQQEVKAGIKVIRDAHKNVNTIAVQNAKMAREDAIATAEVAFSPAIHQETVNEIANELTGMMDDVRKTLLEADNKARSLGESIAENKARIAEKAESLFAVDSQTTKSQDE